MESCRVVRVGSRRSQLALFQTNFIISRLQENFPNIEFKVVKISTKGDKILDVALSKIGDKSLFTKELEEALYEKKIDFVVHSLKDVPTVLPPGLILGNVSNRISPFDVVLMSLEHRGKSLADLPPQSVIGTSALRRVALLRRKYPHLNFESVRGNLATRLNKLDAKLCEPTLSNKSDSLLQPKYDALILAEAGVRRIHLDDRIDQTLDTILYAVGQGALTCECRADDHETQTLLASLHDEPAALACIAERAFMHQLQGGCSTPIGVRTHLLPGGIAGTDAEGGGRPRCLRLDAAVLSLDGSRCVTGSLATELPSVLPEKLTNTSLGTKRTSTDTLASSILDKRFRTSSSFINKNFPFGKCPKLLADFDEEELNTAADCQARVVGLSIHPACAIARLRMARARRLGCELAEQLRVAGADEILLDIKSAASTATEKLHQPTTQISLSQPPTIDSNAVLTVPLPINTS